MSMSFELNRKAGNPFDEDKNGDGIPDGAEVTMAREVMGQDGTRQKMTAKWTKGNQGTQPPVQTPVLSDPEMAQQIFSNRTDRAADLYGIRRTNTDVNPVDVMARKSNLETAAKDTALSVDRRQAAQRTLDQIIAEEQAGEDRTLARDRSELDMRGKQAEVAGKMDIAEIMGRSKVEAAGTTAEAKREITATTLEQKQGMHDDKMKLERDRLASLEGREQARIEMWKSRDTDRAALRAAKDQQSLEKAAASFLDKEFGGDYERKSLRQYVTNTYDLATGAPKTDATPDPVFEQRLNDLNEKWQEAYGRPFVGKGMQVGGKATSGATGKVEYPQGDKRAARIVSGPRQLTPVQQEALAFAKANPNDPRSPGILAKLGM
jgi:hypothetical protein